jgi:hypothetical protein
LSLTIFIDVVEDIGQPKIVISNKNSNLIIVVEKTLAKSNILLWNYKFTTKKDGKQQRQQ